MIMTLPEFLNGYTFVSLYSRILYAHIMYKKLLRAHKKLCCVNKKLFHIEATLCTKIYKKYVVATTKIMTSKRETHV